MTYFYKLIWQRGYDGPTLTAVFESEKKLFLSVDEDHDYILRDEDQTVLTRESFRDTEAAYPDGCFQNLPALPHTGDKLLSYYIKRKLFRGFQEVSGPMAVDDGEIS